MNINTADNQHGGQTKDSSLTWFYWLLWLLPLIFFPLIHEPFETAKYYWLVGGTAVLLLTWSRQANFRFELSHPALLILGAWFLWAVYSTIYSIDAVTSLFGSYGRYNHSIFLYATVFLLVAFGFSRRTELDWPKLLRGWIISAVLVCASGIAQYAGFMTQMDPRTGPIRPEGLLGNSNYSAFFITAMLPYTLIAVIEARSLKERVLYSVALCLLVLGFFLFDSRSALVGLLASLPMLIWGFLRMRKGRLLFGVGIAAVSILGLIMLLPTSSKLAGVAGKKFLEDTNVKSRIYVWATAGEISAGSPWVGYGLGSFHALYGQFRQSNLAGDGYQFDDPHSVYVMMLVSGGWPLLILFLFFCTFIPIFFLFRSSSGQAEMWRIGAGASVVSVFCMAALNPMPIVGFFLIAVPGWMLWPEKLQVFRKAIYIPTAAARAVAGVLCILVISGMGAEVLFYQGFGKYVNRQGDRGLWFLRVADTMTPWIDYHSLFRSGAEVYAKKMPTDEIQRRMQAVARRHSQFALAYQMTGDGYTLLGKQAHDATLERRAIGYYIGASWVDNDSPEIKTLIADEYFRLGNIPAAKRYVQQALTMRPASFSNMLLLAKLNQVEGNESNTLRYLMVAQKLSPGNKNLQHLLEYMKSAPGLMLKTPIPVQVPLTTLE